jgi:DNA-binding response OmpR family regulator
VRTNKILVLEEEVLIAENIRISLEDAEYQVQLSFSVSDALEKVSKWNPNLIIIGVVSKQGLDEVEAAVRIQTSTSNPLKFIFLVSRPISVDDRVKNYETLQKPFIDEELLELVQKQFQ